MKKSFKTFIAILAIFLSVNLAFCLEEGLSYNVLPSGQKVVIKEVRDNNIVKIDTWINTGSINEDDKTTGISHFLEHLFFKGTKNHPTGEFDKILDSKGAHVNAATSKDFTHYYIEIPSEHFDLALSLHADMLQNPMIPEDELEKERKVVIEEISKTKDSPTNRMFENLYSLVYSKSNHPYKRPVIGKKEVIENVSRKEILDYFDKFYTPDSYTTVIVGDVDKNDALKKVSQAFNKGANAKKRQTKINYPKILPLNKIETIEDEMDINKTYVMLGFLAPKFDSGKKGIKENFALDILSTMLTSSKSSILNQELKEKKELVLSISSGNYSQKDSGLFYIYITIDPDKEKEAIDGIIEQLAKIQRGEFDENIIQKAKNQIKTDTYYSRESISNISDDLGYDFTFSSDINFYDNYLKNIDKITKKDIVDAAKKYLILDKYALSIVRAKDAKKELKPVSDTIQKNYDNKLIEQKENTKKTLLQNGATLITKPKKTNSIIAINLSIKGSKAIEKVPLSSMLLAASATSGSKNFTSAQFAQFLDENGIKLSFTSSNDIFSIMVQTTCDNLDKAFIALDEVLNNALFPDDEIEKIKRNKIKELKAISDSPSRFVFDEFKRLAFKDSIYGQNSTFILNNIGKVKRSDIVELYSKIINPENMNIAVVGNIDENYIQNKLNEIIKKNDKGSKFEYSKQNYIPYHPIQNVETKLYKKELMTNWMALGYKIPGVLERKDIATITIINSILGDGMSSRLFTKLREEQALAYSVGSTTSTNVLDGAFLLYIATNVQSIDKAKSGLINQIDRLKKEEVSKKELDDAKDKIMGQLLLSIETNMDEAELLGWYSTLGYDLSAFDEYKNLIKNVSQKDIMDIANKYFSKPYIYSVVLQEGK